MKYRDYMKDRDENLSWCKPYIGKRVSFSLWENHIDNVMIDGKEINPEGYKGGMSYYTSEQVEKVARVANKDYDLYKGWDDLHILLEGEVSEGPCYSCPCFKWCCAMDEKMEGD